jgi:hypothetical protein
VGNLNVVVVVGQLEDVGKGAVGLYKDVILKPVHPQVAQVNLNARMILPAVFVAAGKTELVMLLGIVLLEKEDKRELVAPLVVTLPHAVLPILPVIVFVIGQLEDVGKGAVGLYKDVILKPVHPQVAQVNLNARMILPAVFVAAGKTELVMLLGIVLLEKEDKRELVAPLVVTLPHAVLPILPVIVFVIGQMPAVGKEAVL